MRALSVTSLAATRVPLRRSLYEFPARRFYDANLIDRAEYVLGDRRRDSGTEVRRPGQLKANGRWQRDPSGEATSNCCTGYARRHQGRTG